MLPTGKLPLAEGFVTFIRRVNVAGTVTVLSQAFRVGKRHRGLCLRLVVDTGRVADGVPEWAASRSAGVTSC